MDPHSRATVVKMDEGVAEGQDGMGMWRGREGGGQPLLVGQGVLNDLRLLPPPPPT